MFSSICSASVFGVDGKLISVEVDISRGLPQVNVVGLPDSAVRESIERVRAAIKNSGFSFPMDRITVNLAPADVKKEGSAFDLAIAAGILTASGQLDASCAANTLLIGELSLSGELRPVSGVLAMVDQAKRRGISRIALPAANYAEARLLSGLELRAINELRQLDPHYGEQPDAAALSESVAALSPSPFESGQRGGDYADIAGQRQAKRAMLIAAAGNHNVLLSGPPGTGKTMLIRRLPGILPALSEQEALEVTKIFSIAGKLPGRLTGLIATPPFRAPHHSITAAGLIGGGAVPKPGEATLAHRGVLFLDELPEFSRAVLEQLRQPLEDGILSIVRAKAALRLPASFMLAAASNPCPCGYYGYEQEHARCKCSPAIVARYRARLSGPLLDRIDLQLDVPRPATVVRRGTGEQDTLTTDTMREGVRAARAIQRERNRRFGCLCNSGLGGQGLLTAANLTKEADRLAQDAFEALGISMRAYDRLLRLARTIADVEGSACTDAGHIAEAIQYRRPQPQPTL